MTLDNIANKLSKEQALTATRLREILDYDPDTGIFLWKIKASSKRPIGSRAGSVTSHGYRRIMINGLLYGEHRLAFLWQTGNFPQLDIDHINGDRQDNRWLNLREATPVQNCANSALPKSNKSGHKGVWWNRQRGKWQAMLNACGVRVHLGLFKDRHDACAAYRRADMEFRGEFSFYNRDMSQTETSNASVADR